MNRKRKQFWFFVALITCFFSSSFCRADAMYFKASDVLFINTGEDAVFKSDFGLYAIDDPHTMIKIFDYQSNPGDVRRINASNWGSLQKGFGFYFAIHVGGANDPTAKYYFYSDSSLNHFSDGSLIDADIDHLLLTFSDKLGFQISLEDQLMATADKDFNDMIIKMIMMGMDFFSFNNSSNNSFASTPEPSTALLFGAGLVGLSGVRRRSKKE